MNSIAVGQQFAFLTALEPTKLDGRSAWRCRCVCKTVVTVRTSDLLGDRKKSCGCKRGELIGRHWTTHGHAPASGYSGEYSSWAAMKARCSNPKHAKYALYGGRGISVCDRWQDFSLFLKDLGNRPSPKHSLERTNRDGNYEPGNVIWATNKVQANNRSSTRMLEMDGQTKSMTQWSEDFGLDPRLVWKRLKKGMTLEQALSPKGQS